jgi:hypothetical protein
MVTEVKEWYADLMYDMTVPDEVVRDTVAFNIPEVKEVLEVSRRGKRESWDRHWESAYIRVSLQNGKREGAHVFETKEGMLRLLRRWDGSWGRTITTPEGNQIRVWPGYDMEPIAETAGQGSLF